MWLAVFLPTLCILCVLCVGVLFSVIGGPCKRYAVTLSHDCLPGPNSAASARRAAVRQNARFRGRILSHGHGHTVTRYLIFLLLGPSVHPRSSFFISTPLPGYLLISMPTHVCAYSCLYFCHFCDICPVCQFVVSLTFDGWD